MGWGISRIINFPHLCVAHAHGVQVFEEKEKNLASRDRLFGFGKVVLLNWMRCESDVRKPKSNNSYPWKCRGFGVDPVWYKKLRCVVFRFVQG